MNRNLIMCIAFLVTAQPTRAMEEERHEKIKIGSDYLVLTGHIAKATVYGDAPLNNVDIYQYEHEKLVNKGKFGKFKEKKKWEIFEKVCSKNYVYVAGAPPKLVLGTNERGKVEALLDPSKSKSLGKKLSFRSILILLQTKKK